VREAVGVREGDSPAEKVLVGVFEVVLEAVPVRVSVRVPVPEGVSVGVCVGDADAVEE
jgi:hypothetical protein